MDSYSRSECPDERVGHKELSHLQGDISAPEGLVQGRTLDGEVGVEEGEGSMALIDLKSYA